MKKSLYFVSTNEGKIREAELLLGFPVKIASIELTEIQDFDIENVVKHKANEAFRELKQPLLVDDVGFYVNAWNGFPGPFIKHLLSRGGNELLMKMIAHEVDKSASCVSAIGFHDGKEVHTFLGKVDGVIVDQPRGTLNASGFNAIFIPKGSSKTYSEMTLEEKSTLSHRQKSLEKLKEYLKSISSLIQ